MMRQQQQKNQPKQKEVTIKKMQKNKAPKGKQLRKPISTNFAPKRLAINFDPPMLSTDIPEYHIMQYLVVDTGKLYHHKMRLDSVLRRHKVTREDVLHYIKTKHYLYFVGGKVKDPQVLKFIDKILVRKGIVAKNQVGKGQDKLQQASLNSQKQVNKQKSQNNDDFDYLNDQQGQQQQQYYEQDYQDYEDPSNFINQKQKQKLKQAQQKVAQSKNAKPEQKNTFLTYCQEYEEQQECEPQASWDLDMDQNDDFV